MKKVKVNFASVGPGYDKEDNPICHYLKYYGYEVEITEDADYLICGVLGDPLELCGKPQIRIQHSGENFIPDFNLVDYSISPYPIQFGDRHFQSPAYSVPSSHWLALGKKDRNYSMEFLKGKDLFANFICGHESEYHLRGDFFKQLCQYKRVDSPGTYLNNMPNGEVVNWLNDSKTQFQRRCKFTLCFESTLHYGFTTEKLTDAFYADTIPVYYGPSTVFDVFNKDAFINVADFDSFDAAIEKIIELDQDDEKYLQMLRQPILVDPEAPARLEREFGEFILHIFEQPLEKAYRRSRVYAPKQYDDLLARSIDSDELTTKKLLCCLKDKVVGKISKR